jgi:anti-anti-sigma factor
MTTPVAYALIDGICYLQLNGELRHTDAAPLEALIERLFGGEQPPARAAVIDLNHCTFMDSTVLGLLASIARELADHGLPRATVFCTQSEILHLLGCLCLTRVFHVVQRPTDPMLTAALFPAETPVDDLSGRRNAQTILKAHEALIAVDEHNREAFQAVVELFREQLREP